MSHGSSSGKSTDGDKNIIGFDCKIYGNPIVGDNSGNGKSKDITNNGNGKSKDITNNGGGINVIPPKTSDKVSFVARVGISRKTSPSNFNVIPPKTSDKGKSPQDGQCDHNSRNQNVIKICGDNKGNKPDVERNTQKDGHKNSRDPSSQFGGNYIIGDNSGNTDDNPNGGRNENMKHLPGFKRKNVIEHNTQIEGNCIVGDNSGNIDGNPNGGGKNKINNLLQEKFNYKNATEKDTRIKGNFIVGDVSGNNKGKDNTRIEWNTIVGDVSGNKKGKT